MSDTGAVTIVEARPAADTASSRASALRRSSTRPATGYLPGLDGIRAIAVLAVIAYHGGLSWMRGGFLGVEVFFVVSGFLITRILLRELDLTGRIDLRHFWMRRVKRLVPALIAVLTVTSAYLLIAASNEVARFRGEVIAALLYVANWYFIVNDESYFDALGRPSPFRHLWSLAIEEQFYLFWPLILLVLWRLVHRRPGAAVSDHSEQSEVDQLATSRSSLSLPRLLVGAALLSHLVMAIRFRGDADPTAIYYSTFTRAGGLLLGAALAFVWKPERRLAAQIVRRVSLAGVVGLVVLAALHVLLGELSAATYRGGFLVTDLATLLVIMAATVRDGALNLVLGNRVLRWIGVRSYGLYLWHWPVFVFTRPGEDTTLSGLALWGVRLGLTFALTELCFRFVETPFREGLLGRVVRDVRDPAIDKRRHDNLFFAAFSCVTIVALLAIGIATRPAQSRSNEIAEALQENEDLLASQTLPQPTTTPETTIPTTTTVAAIEPGASVPAAAETTTTAPPTTPAPPVAPASITVIGDSVILGAADAFLTRYGGSVYVNAEVSRSTGTVIDVANLLVAGGQLGDVVIIQTGNNGRIGGGQLDQLLSLLANVPTVILINVRVPRPWQDENNATIAATAPNYPNVKLLDWFTATADKGDWFYSDGTHLRPAGRQGMVDLIDPLIAG
jgi:peptidoglycan/LPS O-acetylase OafA/YrhL